MSASQKLYALLLLLTVASLGAFLVDFLLPSGRRGPIVRGATKALRRTGLPASEVRFVDRTRESGVALPPADLEPIDSITQVMGSGVGLADVDGDRDLDLYVVRGGAGETARNRLFWNEGNGTFIDATDETGAGDAGDGMGCVFGDVDNDGDLDLYVTNRGPNVLLLNEGPGTFRDGTADAGVGDSSWSTGAAFGDLDGDGLLDLYVANYLTFDAALGERVDESRFDREDPVALLPHPFPAEPDRLYRNLGQGLFVDVTQKSGIVDLDGRGLGVVISDLDVDGDMDIYVANDASSNFLFANRGDGTFESVAMLVGVDDPRSGMGLAVGDFDLDGLPDIFVTNWQDESNALYQGVEGAPGTAFAGDFVDAAGFTGLLTASVGRVGWGTGFLDFDGDGYEDLLVVNGYTTPGPDASTTCIPQAGQLFRNEGGRAFVEVDAGRALEGPRNGRGAAFGDLDGDGDVDVVITTNRGELVILQNEGGNRSGYLRVRLRGTQGNRDGVGARVVVEAGGRRMTREVRAGSSYLCHGGFDLLFGLGGASGVDSVEVHWPSGAISRYVDVQTNGTLPVKEPEE